MRAAIRARMARTLLATGALVLVLSTSASAECAWVLWSWHFVTGVNGPEPRYERPVVAYPTVEMCLDSTPRGEEFGKGGRFYQCWPDTIDPRGPKGKP